jgi:hypothetical protein
LACAPFYSGAFIDGTMPQKFVAVLRQFVYKTQFDRPWPLFGIPVRPDLAKAFFFYHFGQTVKKGSSFPISVKNAVTES